MHAFHRLTAEKCTAKKKIHLTTYYTFKSHSSSNNNTIKVKTVSSPVSVQFHKAILEIALLAQDDII